jgi:hypothetical protein
VLFFFFHSYLQPIKKYSFLQRVSRSQDGDISPLPAGRGLFLGEMGAPFAFLVSLTKIPVFHHHKLTDFPIRCTIYYFQKQLVLVKEEGGYLIGRLFRCYLAAKFVL